MSNPVDARRRWFGLFFLFISIGLVVWGQTLLKPHLKGFAFVLYWLACFGFTLLALFTALVDLMVVRHRTRQEHRQLLEKTWDKIDIQSTKSKPGNSQGSDQKAP